MLVVVVVVVEHGLGVLCVGLVGLQLRSQVRGFSDKEI